MRRAAILPVAASTLIGCTMLSWHFTVHAPNVRAPVETALVISGLASIMLVWNPWIRSRRAPDLVVLAALLALVLSDLVFFATPGLAGSGSPALAGAMACAPRFFVAALFAAAALVPGTVRTPDRSRATMLLTLAAICVIAVGLAPSLVAAAQGGPGAVHGTNLAAILTLPAVGLLLVAAAGFVRRALCDPAGMIDALLGGVAILVAAEWAYDLLFGGLTHQSVAGSVFLRAVCFGVILVVAVEVRARERRTEIQDVVARERRRFTGYLHDAVAQDLAVIAAHEPRLTLDFGAEHPVCVAARQALAAARGVIVDLSASDQSTAGDALRAIAGELARRHAIRVDVDAGSEQLTDEKREAVVRIAREAIVNAATHGEAENITISLRTDGSQLVLAIVDDGCGIAQTLSVSDAPQAGYGLRTMDQWADAIGGRLTMRTRAQGGTAVEVSVS